MAILATTGLIAACAGPGASTRSRAGAPAYKVGATGKALSAAVASRDPAAVRKAQARAARASSPASARSPTHSASRAAPAASQRRVASASRRTTAVAGSAVAPTQGTSAATLAQGSIASDAATPETAVAQHVALDSPRATTPAPVRSAPAIGPWSDRLWLLAALAVLALAALAAWVMRPRRREEAPVALDRALPTPANDTADTGEPTRRARRQDPPPPTVTILAARQNA